MHNSGYPSLYLLDIWSGHKMSWNKHDYDAIPGTYVFDGKRANSSFAINKMLFSFNKEKNRSEYHENPEAYANKFGLPDEHKAALLKGDYLKLLRQGANIYYVAKLIIPQGISVQDAGAAFQEISTEEFIQNLKSKGNGLTERLEEQGGYWNG